MDFNLLNNALDFLEDAIDKVSTQDPTEKDIKYAILHLHSAVELLLKQVLYNEHWSLVFQDINKADYSILNSALKGEDAEEFKTVFFYDAIKRISKICKIDIKKHDKKALKKLKTKRNQIEHFGIRMEKNDALKILYHAWPFILNFSGKVLTEYDVGGEGEKKLENIKRKMVSVSNFVKKEEKRLKECLQGAVDLLSCPFCNKKLIPVFEDNFKGTCRLCNTSLTSFEEEETPFFIKLKTVSCPECGGPSLHKYEDWWFCSNSILDMDSGELVRCKEFRKDGSFKLIQCEVCKNDMVDEGNSKCNDCLYWDCIPEDTLNQLSQIDGGY